MDAGADWLEEDENQDMLIKLGGRMTIGPDGVLARERFIYEAMRPTLMSP